jgi:hypothetical protein
MNLTFFINWKGTTWNIIRGWSGLLGQNWAWEFNLYRTHSWIMIDVSLRPQGDHRGVFFMAGLLGRAVDVNIYDTRHREE